MVHRWDYSFELDQYECVDPGIADVNSGQRCWPGCGAVVTDNELNALDLPISIVNATIVNFLLRGY